MMGRSGMSKWWGLHANHQSQESFAVIGLGRFGKAVCKELIDAGVEPLVLDRESRIVEQFQQGNSLLEARIVDCTDEEALRQGGVLEMDTVVIAISEPLEASLTATFIVKEAADSRVRKVISRATSILHEKMLRAVGADEVVFPSREQGRQLGERLVRPNLLDRLKLDDKNRIEEIRVPDQFVGRSLRDLNLRKDYGVSVLAAGSESALKVNPPASLVLSKGDLLVVMGVSEALNRLPSA